MEEEYMIFKYLHIIYFNSRRILLETDCQSFLTLATIVCYINIEPYQVMDKETGRLVIPRKSILIF